MINRVREVSTPGGVCGCLGMAIPVLDTQENSNNMSSFKSQRTVWGSRMVWNLEEIETQNNADRPPSHTNNPEVLTRKWWWRRNIRWREVDSVINIPTVVESSGPNRRKSESE